MRVLLFALLTTLSAGPLLAQNSVRVTGAPISVVTSADAEYARPFFSPTGNQLAFTTSGFTGLYVVPTDGGAITRLSSDAGVGFGSSWSPDGSAIVARLARQDGLQRMSAVALFDVAGGEMRLLSDLRPAMTTLPVFSPAGDQVVLSARGHVDVFESGLPVVAGKGAAPLVTARGNRIEQILPASSTAATLRTFVEGDVLNLVTSADGSMVAFELLGGDLHVMQSDGSALVALGRGEAPSFSPDGRWVVFMRTQDDGHHVTGSDLFAASIDGSRIVQLTNTSEQLEMYPNWSPDGTRIAFDDRGSIYLLPVVIE
jgi:dipeptidyl aminopeptidase/acylaminoacyl peptidase